MDVTRVSIQSLQKVSKTRANIMIIMAINETLSDMPFSYDDNPFTVMKNVELLKVNVINSNNLLKHINFFFEGKKRMMRIILTLLFN